MPPATKPLVITATHFHGDHLGMLPAFSADDQVEFWLSRGEFAERELFPRSNATWFDGAATLNLGGITVDPLALPGHTRRSSFHCSTFATCSR